MAGTLHDIEGFQSQYTPDDHPFERFYTPALAASIAYDRVVGYWSANALQYAAQGLAHFIAAGGEMRLIVGASLRVEDVDALTNGTPLPEIVAQRLMDEPGVEGTRIIEDEYLSVLAWMAAHNRLSIRVGVPFEDGRYLSEGESGKYFHSKIGIFTDAEGNSVAFNGSSNESVRGWILNHETVDTYPTWLEAVWQWSGREKVDTFEKLWNGFADSGWKVIPLPEAVRRHLISHAPAEPPLPKSVRPVGHDLSRAWAELVELAEAPKRTPYTAVGTAWVKPLPHQAHLVKRVVESYPRGYLLADQVGLGKTVEAGLVVRELLLSGKARTALLLVPASVMRQWQEELHEKMNLDVPRMTAGGFLDRFDQPIPADPSANPWSAFPIVLGSSHLARRRSRRSEIQSAGPWDIVFIDEAHHARRRGSKPTDTPNALLSLLLAMKEQGKWKALYLATATPMQMAAHEAWDLLMLLDLPGRWGQSAQNFETYYHRLAEPPETRNWTILSEMLGDYFRDPEAETDEALKADIERELGFFESQPVWSLQSMPPSKNLTASMPSGVSDCMDRWLRRHTPTRDRVFRNTRATMREYQAAGILDANTVIPERDVADEFLKMTDNERKLYDRIERYIKRHYNAYRTSASQQALGFIMTVYRRRLTSSFAAIRCSLQRRLDVLERGDALINLIAEDDAIDLEPALFEIDTLDVSADLLKQEITELKTFISEMNWMVGEDTKATRLVTDVNEALRDQDSVVVFTQYTDTMEYIRERLIAAGITRIGCYSGRGGEVYHADTDTWVLVSKPEIKISFTRGELAVLVGTDAMSEGLNLQTCGRLINYDVPWNLMRVEQRIGRVDRIGATYPLIKVSNYFYRDTVEEQVYTGIKQDFVDFTDIIGGAAPVLASIEQVIQALALGSGGEVGAAVDSIRQQVRALAEKDVKDDDFGNAPATLAAVERPPELVGGVSIKQLGETLLANPLTSPLFRAGDVAGTYELTMPSERAAVSLSPDSGPGEPSAYTQSDPGTTVVVTFERKVADESQAEVVLLTYGTPELTTVLPRPPRKSEARG